MLSCAVQNFESVLKKDTTNKEVFGQLCLEKTKNKYLEDLTLGDINDNKRIWKTVNLLFRNKVKGKSKIGLNKYNVQATHNKTLAKFSIGFLSMMQPVLEVTSRNLLLIMMIAIKISNYLSTRNIRSECKELNSPHKVETKQISMTIKRLYSKKF